MIKKRLQIWIEFDRLFERQSLIFSVAFQRGLTLNWLFSRTGSLLITIMISVRGIIQNFVLFISGCTCIYATSPSKLSECFFNFKLLISTRFFKNELYCLYVYVCVWKTSHNCWTNRSKRVHRHSIRFHQT